jgi:hypothetical protein
MEAPHNILSNIILSRLSPYIMKLLGIMNITDQLLIRFSAVARHLRKETGLQ